MRFLLTTSLLRCIDIVLKIRIFHTDVQDLLKVKVYIPLLCVKYSFKYRFGNIGIEFTPHILYITRDKTFVYSKCFGLRPFINCTCVEIIEISNTLTRTVIRKTDCTYIKLQNSFPVLVCYDRQQTCGVKYV